MVDIYELLERKFKSNCVDLKNHLHKYHDRLSFREESHDTSFGVENSLEIIVSRLINEDNYGIVYSLIIKKQKKGDLKFVELSAIKGDGSIIEDKDFEIKEDLIKYDEVMNDFLLSIDHFSKKVVEILENEYLT
jgi:hypothetical protein